MIEADIHAFNLLMDCFFPQPHEYRFTRLVQKKPREALLALMLVRLELEDIDHVAMAG